MESKLTGFGNYFESESIPGSLPKGQNSPQKLNHNLYAELLSGSAFTQPRDHNLQAWLYKLKPSVTHGGFRSKHSAFWSGPSSSNNTSPEQLRWLPMPSPVVKQNFVDAMTTMASCGQCGEAGVAIHHFVANESMNNTYFYNSDAEMLIVAEQGQMRFHTEMGVLAIEPCEIIIIPRGIKFKVDLIDETARGYALENFGSPFRLPDLGPIGSNGLASPRDFIAPMACAEQNIGASVLVNKFDGKLWQAELKDSPLDVVAWHGNYVPYKYDLRKFNTMNTVSFDHADPSIFTVLTSPSEVPGRANVDFVIFPPRWIVSEHSFRPPYYHRNRMSEYMGLIHGKYDAKEEGFLPGGASLHNCMSAHGPELSVFKKASSMELKPEYMANTLAFMFETNKLLHPTDFAMKASFRDLGYLNCWDGFDE